MAHTWDCVPTPRKRVLKFLGSRHLAKSVTFHPRFLHPFRKTYFPQKFQGELVHTTCAKAGIKGRDRPS